MRFWISYTVSAAHLRGIGISFYGARACDFFSQPTEQEIRDLQGKIREEFRGQIRDLTCTVLKDRGRDISMDCAQERMESVVDKNCPEVTVIAFSRLSE